MFLLQKRIMVRFRADKSILDKGESEVLGRLDVDIRQYDEGKAAEAEPF